MLKARLKRLLFNHLTSDLTRLYTAGCSTTNGILIFLSLAMDHSKYKAIQVHLKLTALQSLKSQITDRMITIEKDNKVDGLDTNKTGFYLHTSC